MPPRLFRPAARSCLRRGGGAASPRSLARASPRPSERRRGGLVWGQTFKGASGRGGVRVALVARAGPPPPVFSLLPLSAASRPRGQRPQHPQYPVPASPARKAARVLAGPRGTAGLGAPGTPAVPTSPAKARRVPGVGSLPPAALSRLCWVSVLGGLLGHHSGLARVGGGGGSCAHSYFSLCSLPLGFKGPLGW